MHGDDADDGRDARQDRPLRLRSADVEWREVEGEVVVLDLRRNEYLGVNRTGAVVWDALVSGATHEELVGLLVDRFNLDRAKAVADADDFVQELADRDLLER